MTMTLRTAAAAVLARWDSPQWEWTKHGPTADLMAALRAALAQPAATDAQPVAWDWKAPSEKPEAGRLVDVMMYAGPVGNPTHPGFPGKPWVEAGTECIGFSNFRATFITELVQTGVAIAWRYAAAQPAPSTAPNLSCTSVQARLAEQWGYVRAQPAPQPLTTDVMRDMLDDTREVFDASGPETPQVVRDVIEYVASWLSVYADKRGITAAPTTDKKE